MKSELETLISQAVKELFDIEVSVDLTRPEEQFGDYATNVALQLSKEAGKNPREIGEQLAEKLRNDLSNHVSEVTVAGPGFLNLKLTTPSLLKLAQTEPKRTLEGKTVVAEYSDPNPFKVLHAGHLYTTLVGDSISRLLEQAGAKVHRLNYGGDVGLHVGKTMWAIIDNLGEENAEKLNDVQGDRLEWLSQQYVRGNEAYENNAEVKASIITCNKRIYQVHNDNDQDSQFAKIYWKCRKWSYDGFKGLYKQLQVEEFERFIPESEVTPLGLEIVREGLSKGVFKESDGAVVFEGEPHGLHTRVFVNSEGLPTYEAKELGLAVLKYREYKFNQNFIITGNDIVEYMKVVLAALASFYPEVVGQTRHLTHGMIKLPGGVKMSSRLGNILGAYDILVKTQFALEGTGRPVTDETFLGAIKYSLLKQRVGGDLIYDPEESVSLEGNSGPYLQYAHARARSILGKSTEGHPDRSGGISVDLDQISRQARDDNLLEDGERSLLRKLAEFTEVIDRAVAEMMPHHICTYLYELSQSFNFFYEHNRVIGEDREAIRVALVEAYADRLRQGLTLLGIASPDKM